MSILNKHKELVSKLFFDQSRTRILLNNQE